MAAVELASRPATSFSGDCSCRLCRFDDGRYVYPEAALIYTNQEILLVFLLSAFIALGVH